MNKSHRIQSAQCGGPACRIETGWYHRGELTERLRDFGQPTRQVDHILRWSPNRVRDECETKRRIVEGMQPYGPIDDINAAEILPLLALPYADHPDYQEEWK